MITEENYVRTREIAMKAFRASGALDETPDFQKRVNCIVATFQPIYIQLQSEKLLPEGMDFNLFQQVIIPRLQQAAHEYQIQRMFSN